MQFLSVLSFVLTLASAPVAPQAGQNAHTQECLSKGRRYLAQKQFAQAVSALRHCKQIAPRDPNPYFFSGIALAESGRLIEAASELAEAARLGPGQAEYTLTYANVLSLLKQNYLAAKVLAPFEKQAGLDHLTTPRLWLLHDIYMRMLREDEAIRVLDLIGLREPSNPRVQLQRAKIYRLKQQLDLAEATLNKILGNPTSTAAANYELAKILQQRKETTAAKAALLKAVQREENNSEYLCELGSVCVALGDVDEAIQYLKRAEPAAASFPQIYYVLGQAYLKKGERDKGAAYLKKVQELNAAARQKQIEEQQELTFITKGEELLDKGSVAEAKSQFEQARLTNPKNWHANEYLAKIALNTGDSQNADRYVAVLEEIDSHSFEANFLRALYLYQRKSDKQARDSALRAMAAQPLDAEVHNLLGNIYLRLGLTAKAIDEYSLACKLAPDRSDFREDLQKASKLISPAKPLQQ